MEEAASRSHRTAIIAFALIAFALIVALVLMHNADAADRAERARLEMRLDELSKQMSKLQADMATAPSAAPVHELLDASVGDFPTPQIPKIKLDLNHNATDTAHSSDRNDPGY